MAAKKKTEAKPTREQICKQVTDTIIAKLKEGTVPWRKPWKVSAGMDGLQYSLSTKKPYRGMNQILLGLSEYDCQWWATPKLVAKKGGTIRKGEQPTYVLFMQFPSVIDRNDPKLKRMITVPYLRFFEVYNLEQCEGIDIPVVEVPKDWDPIENAEKVLPAMPAAPLVKHSVEDRAYYMPALDYVHLPVRKAFHTPEGYYNTLFHELAHATGHTNRLNRKELMSVGKWGDILYSEEELTAEMTAAIVARSIGMQPNLDASAAYIKSWLRKLQDDPHMVIQAANKAQTAADWVLNQRQVHKPKAKPKKKTTKAKVKPKSVKREAMAA